MKQIGIQEDSVIRGNLRHDNPQAKIDKGNQLVIRAPKTTTSPSDEYLAVCVLASGSRGNAIYISNGSTSILIDAGLSGIELQRRLKAKGICPEELSAIVVSHEHSDHTQGVGVLSRRFNLPVFINPKTHRAAHQLGKISDLRTFDCGTPFRIDQIHIHPFSTSHDAEDPSGFTIGHNGKKIGLATDMGIATSMVKSHLSDCTFLILEANHDPDMLQNGPYPWPLKQRIKSRTGHMSNEASKALLQEIRHDRLEHVILAHLSEINNTPERALHVVGQALLNSSIGLSTAAQDTSGDTFYIR